jgi:hypothetical protein
VVENRCSTNPQSDQFSSNWTVNNMCTKNNVSNTVWIICCWSTSAMKDKIWTHTYANSYELEKRRKIFNENLEWNENFNNVGNKSYKFILKPYIDLTSQEKSLLLHILYSKYQAKFLPSKLGQIYYILSKLWLGKFQTTCIKHVLFLHMRKIHVCVSDFFC